MPKIKKATVGKSSKSPKRKSGGLEITPIDYSDVGLKVSLFGRSGTGKTTLWSTFPGPILAVLCSSTGKPTELRSIAKKDRDKISKVDLRDPEDILEVPSLVKKHQVTTVVIDHLSALQDMTLAKILGVDKLPEQKSWGMASRDEYRQCAQDMKTYLRALFNMNTNTILIAQERVFENDEDDELLMPFVGSAVQPAVAYWLYPEVDYMAQTFIRAKTVTKKIKVGRGKFKEKVEKTGEKEYCLRVGPSEIYQTKFRKPKHIELPEVIVDPDYNKLMELIEGFDE